MARIPESEIERLKSEISLERLIEAAGIQCLDLGARKLPEFTASVISLRPDLDLALTMRHDGVKCKPGYFSSVLAYYRYNDA